MKRIVTAVQQKKIEREHRNFLSILAEQLLAGLAWYG
jgi:hypothetical protein